MTRARLASAIVCWLLAPAAAQREPALKEVIGRVGTYVDAYGENASAFVGTETYEQEATGSAGAARQHRVLVSEFAIVRTDGLGDAAKGKWTGFRDVIDVDGKPVADRRDRLIRILTDAAATLDDARQLSDESSRFNVGNIVRNFNVPTASLFFFQRANLFRFKFTKRATARIADLLAWEIEFRETSRPSLVRMPTGESLMSEGRLWASPSDGTVFKTHLQIQGFSFTAAVRTSATVDVTFARVPNLGVWLPETMTEDYAGNRGGGWDRVTGTARYTNYRRFETNARIK